MAFLSQPSPEIVPSVSPLPVRWRREALGTRLNLLDQFGDITSQNKGQIPLKLRQLVLQHCCTTSWKAMLCVLLSAFKPDNNLICCKAGLMWLVKRATSLFNSFRSRIVVLIYPVHYAIDRFESVVPKGFYSPALALMFRSPNHPSNIPQCCI